MYDPDASHNRPLRLGAPPLTLAKSPGDRLTEAEEAMNEAIMRWVEATMEWAAIQRQMAPISAQRRPTEQTDRQALARYTQTLTDYLRPTLTEHDTRVHQHAAGPHPMVFRTTGHAERLDAAARGEIGDPAEQLRQERLVMALNGFDPIDAPL